MRAGAKGSQRIQRHPKSIILDMAFRFVFRADSHVVGGRMSRPQRSFRLRLSIRESLEDAYRLLLEFSLAISTFRSRPAYFVRSTGECRNNCL